MISQEFIIAAADKSILKISGIHVRGLNTQDLERCLSERLHTLVRVIGVTGEQIEMDVYGIDTAQIRKDEKAVRSPLWRGSAPKTSVRFLSVRKS